MSASREVHFTDNSIIQSRAEQYIEITVDADAILKSWRQSLFSHEWLLPDGQIKPAKELPAAEQPKRESVELALAGGRTIAKPVLGIGLLDNVEIGAGKAEFLTLAALGYAKIPVHIPKSNESDFKAFLSHVD